MSRDGRRRVLSYEERVLWTTVTKGFTPLRETADISVDIREAEPSPTRPRKAPPVFVKPAKASRPVAAVPQPKPAPPPKAAPELAPLTRRMKRNVARGKEGIDARLDLHGLTQAEAHGTLLRFLRAASARDARLVLIITGKGRSSANRAGEFGERGVLRRQVPHWLGQPEFRDFVIGVEDAHVAHGGEGALYVRLRRARST